MFLVIGIVISKSSSKFPVEWELAEDAFGVHSAPERRKVLLFFLSFPPSGNGKLASWASILGFVVMMSLDVGLG